MINKYSVRQLQRYLRKIAYHYNIKKVAVDGIFDEETEQAVKDFQNLFNLPITGKVDLFTWSKIVEVFDAIEDDEREWYPLRICDSQKMFVDFEEDKGRALILQAMLFSASAQFENITPPQLSGKYDDKTRKAVADFQKEMSLDAHGEVDKATWQKLASIVEKFVCR